MVEWPSAGPVAADAFAGRIHAEWDYSVAVTPFGQMPIFVEFVTETICWTVWWRTACCTSRARMRRQSAM